MTVLTISQAARQLASGEISSEHLVDLALDRIARHDAHVGAILETFPEAARRAAGEADARAAEGRRRGPLDGIPLGIKGILTTREAPSTAQSHVRARQWEQADAEVVRRLRHAGAVVVGTTTTMEYAIGLPDDALDFPVPRNPWDLERYAGGSSSGSASGVAMGALLGAVGTDTAGSIRAPAAFCGVTGLKPTYGRLPTVGCIPLSSSLDTIGPMARSAEDCALLLDVMAGTPAAADVAAPQEARAAEPLRGLRVGVDRLQRVAGDREHPEFGVLFTRLVDTLAGLGAEVVPVELPLYDEMVAATTIVMLSEAFAYHAATLRSSWQDYGRWTRAVLACGVYYTGADYVLAQQARHIGRREMSRLFGHVDAVVTPTAVAVAPSMDELGAIARGGTEGFRYVYTGYWNALGNPVVSIPMGLTTDSLPLGAQIAGRPDDDALVLRIGRAVQDRTDWHLRAPDL